MVPRIKVRVVEEALNPWITGFGVFFFIVRAYCMNWLKLEDGAYYGDISHASYLVSLLVALAMVCSFKNTYLNTVSLAILPSVLITIPLHDVPRLLNPEFFLTVRWWNSLTIHTSVLIVGIYVFANRKHLVNRTSMLLVFLTIIGYFLAFDNKDNGVLDSWLYIGVGLGVGIAWFLLLEIWFLRDCQTIDAFTAQSIRFDGIAWK
jgi:hypothetical protein